MQVGAKCIIVLAGSGKTARILAKYRPGVPIVVRSVTPPYRKTCRCSRHSFLVLDANLGPG